MREVLAYKIYLRAYLLASGARPFGVPLADRMDPALGYAAALGRAHAIDHDPPLTFVDVRAAVGKAVEGIPEPARRPDGEG